MKKKALLISIGALAPIYKEAVLDKKISGLYLRHCYDNDKTPEEVVEQLTLVHSLAAGQCKTIEAFVRDAKGDKVEIYPAEIKALATSALTLSKTRQSLSRLNISLFFH